MKILKMIIDKRLREETTVGEEQFGVMLEGRQYENFENDYRRKA